MRAVVFAKNSERFPNKHMSSAGKTTLIDCVISEILRSERISGVIIYSRDRSVTSGLCATINDSTEGSLADSLLSALDAFGDLFAFAGDMPCISHEIIDEMISLSDGISVIPEHPDGKIEPLHSIYSSSYSEILESNLKGGMRSLRDFIERIPHAVYRIKAENMINFLNINHEDELDRFRQHGCR